MTRWIFIVTLLCFVFSGCQSKQDHYEAEKAQNSDKERIPSQVNANSFIAKPFVQSPSLESTLPPQIIDLERNAPGISSSLSPTIAFPTPSAVDSSLVPDLPHEQVQSLQTPSSPPKRTVLGTPNPLKPLAAVQRTKGKQLSSDELRKKYPDYFKIKGSSAEKKVAFTFDDGPDLKYTPEILDILKKNDIKATFFLVGSRSEACPDMVRRIVNEGHTVGNHLYNHPNPAKLNLTQYEQQIEQTQNILHNLIGYSPKLIRPPYGAINEEQLKWSGMHNFVVVNWDVDSLDWKQLDAKQVSANILNNTRKGSIILQHSAGGNRQNLSGTVQALPLIIQKLKADGYIMVSVPQLLHVSISK